ncbi:MAG TPA: ATP-binding protein [Usitatibacter sp.]|nr:ATP-binding protein [Usitatibacter sp.]
MVAKTLKFKVGLYLATTLTTTLLLFAVLVVSHQRSGLLEAAAAHVNQLSDVIIRSTRFAMLKNEPDHVHSIIQDVARLENIARVRIYSKEGVIIDSSIAAEIGMRVDRKAEGCVQCHQNGAPRQRVPRHERARTFETADGRRMLASMEVIRNEPSCYTAACHAHKREQSVLGVLDISYPLEEIDSKLRASATRIVALSFLLVVVSSVLLGILVRRSVYVPLRDLETGAKRIASGNLNEAIPVRDDDEFGRLAGAFNSMTSALRSSREELRQAAATLEQKVAERTEALHRAQAEALRGEKLASVGLLAAGVAHELNNPLTGVLTFSTLMRKKVPDGSQDAEDLDLVIRETRRCAGIIRRLLDFAREKRPEKSFADLNRVIEETARLVERPARLSDIAIVLDLDPELPRAWVDADLMKQVFMNILVNAQHAIGAKGTITVRTRRLPASPDGGARVEIAVTDDGCGIAAKDLARIFDPFFTTKGVGQGTGLGLSVSHGIVTAHGGTIDVESEPGVGSTFSIRLPIEAAESAAASEAGATA